MKLMCYILLCKYSYYNDLTLEKFEYIIFFNYAHTFYCDGVCNIKFANLGDIALSFIDEKTLDEIRDVPDIMLYFNM